MFWMPKGANPDGMDGSANAPAQFCCWKLPLNTSTVPKRKLVAYR
jgi:hypothetical protein